MVKGALMPQRALRGFARQKTAQMACAKAQAIAFPRAQVHIGPNISFGKDR